MKLHVIHYASVSDLPESVLQQVSDEAARTTFLAALNASLGGGASEMNSFLKAWRALADAGYAKTDAGWVKKDSPGVGDVHVNRPLKFKKPNPPEGSGNENLDIPGDEMQKADSITLDVPLFLKLLEAAREEIKSDEPLHVLAEKVIALSQDGETLDMSDYGSIMSALKKREKRVEEKDDPGTQDVHVDEDELVEAYIENPPALGQGQEVFAKRISGNSDIKLNAKGRELAKRLGERLKLKGGLDVLYSSTLPRGIETADAIAAADPNVHRAAVTPAVCPWHIGEMEGKEPKDIHHLMDHYLENPDERPPGKGADGKPAETFKEAEKRQLDFLSARRVECEDHPTLKIGVVMHSRGMELAQAWNDDGCPKDYDTKLVDLEHPHDPLHADVLRWHKDQIKEVDLDSNDELKPGLYLILHSLTDDDSDDGNTELEKGGPGSGLRPGQRKAAQASHANLMEQHDAAFTHPGRTQVHASDDAVADYKSHLYGLRSSIEAHGKEFGMPPAAATHMANATNALMTRGNTVVGREASLMHMHNALRAIGHGLKKVEKAERPPHLRTTAGTERCANCEHYNSSGHCELYGNYPVTADQLCDDWTAKGAAGKEGDPVAKCMRYLPPLEVQQACKRAYDVGIAAEITSAVVEGEGLDEAQVRDVAKHFAAVESRTDSPAARDAWGGRHAARWAARVLKKSGKEWSKWSAWDLDGTLAEKTADLREIGAPREKEVARLKEALAVGKTVKIFTARVADDPEGEQRKLIEAWCLKVFGKKLPITNEKDPGMVEVRDDLAVPLAKAGSSVMVAFWPDAQTQKQFAVKGGEKAEDLHVTLAYFGKLAEISMDEIPALESALTRFAADHGPIKVTLGGIGRFPATPQSDGMDVAYLGVHGDCQKFRDELVKACEAAGAEPKKNFGWNPHVTLKTVSPHAPHLLPTPEPKAITFDEIVLSVGSAKKAYKLTGVNKWDSEDEPDASDTSNEEDRLEGEDESEDTDKVELRADIVKLDGEQQMAFGWFSVVKVGDRSIVDTQDDLITPETIEASAYKFVLDSRKGGEMHEPGSDGKIRGVGRLVESVVFTAEKVNAMVSSLAQQGVVATIDLGCEAWWGGFLISDPDTWDKVKTGELRAWSIGGRGKRAAM